MDAHLQAEFDEHTAKMYTHLLTNIRAYVEAKVHIAGMHESGEVVRPVALGRYWCYLICPPGSTKGFAVDAAWYKGFIDRVQNADNDSHGDNGQTADIQ